MAGESDQGADGGIAGGAGDQDGEKRNFRPEGEAARHLHDAGGAGGAVLRVFGRVGFVMPVFHQPPGPIWLEADRWDAGC